MTARNPDYLTPPPPANSLKDSAGQARPQRKPWSKPTLRLTTRVNWRKLQSQRRPWSKPTLRSADSLMYVSSNPSDGKMRDFYEQINSNADYRNPS